LPLDPAPECSAAPSSTAWRASLALAFESDGVRTRLARREHSGPLVVQRVLHPEGPELAQAAIVHPPGGIAGGDHLALDVDVRERARVQLVTPAATKWYRARAAGASQRIAATVADGAALEWLPHEAIVFDGAHASMQSRLALHGTAVAITWEVVALGRAASGERFVTGSVRQRFEVVRGATLQWVEQGVLDAASALRTHANGLDGHAAFGTLVLAAPCIEDAWLAAARKVGSELAVRDFGITRVPGVLVARARAPRTAGIQAWFSALWSVLRPLALGRAAIAPRLWAT
jgi:urease accessory protein